MVAGVHGRTADLGALAQPAAAACLATGLVLVLDVTDLADRGLAADVNPAQLAARHPDHGVIALFRQQLSACTGGPDQLTAATERELDVVHGRTHRDVLQRDRIADPDGRLWPRLDRVANLQADRSEDVALLSVLVVDERDPGAAVGVVLDGRDLARDAVLVALEVDLPVQLAIAAALMARGDAALVVAAGVSRQGLEQRLLRRIGRDLVEAGDRHEATARAGGLELSNRHQTDPNSPSIFWPSPRVTIAFFQSVVRPTWPEPMRRKLRRFLPRIVTVLMSLTWMPCDSYCSSRAFLISVLEAVPSTLN